MTTTANTDTGTRAVTMEREMSHSADKVWRALTQGPLIAEWLMANDFEAKVGHRFTFRTTPMPQWNGIVEGEVLVVEPQRRLAYRWDTGDDPATGLRTIVTWTLTPTPRGVLVRMEQTGFRPSEEQNYRGAQYGWTRFLEGLERVAGGLS